MTLVRAVLASATALLLAGCGGQPSASSAATTGATPAPTGRTIAVEGTVEPGVESGCLLLGGYLLLGGDRSVIAAGARLRVTGTRAVGVVTTCQQGTPLTVRSAEPLD